MSARACIFAVLMAATLNPVRARAEVVPLSWVRSRALAEHPQLAANAARVEAAQADIRSAQSGRKPRISASVDGWTGPGGQQVELLVDGEGQLIPRDPEAQLPRDATNIRVGGAPVISEAEAFRPIPRASADVGLDWRIHDFGRTSSAIRAARWEARARQAREAATAEALVEALDAAYLDWLETTERVRLEAAALTRARDRLARREARVEAGAASESQTWPLRTDVAARELRIAELEQVAAEARLALEAAAGIDLPAGATPDLSLLALGTQPRPEERRPAAEVEALNARAEAAEARVEELRRANHPELRGNAELGVRLIDDSVFPLWRVGLGLSIPIWQGGENAARADAARAEARALRAEKAEAEAEADRERDRHQLALSRARRRVDLAQRLLDVAEARLEDVKRRPEGSAEHADELDRARAQRDEALQAVLGAKIDRTFAALRLDSGG